MPSHNHGQKRPNSRLEIEGREGVAADDQDASEDVISSIAHRVAGGRTPGRVLEACSTVVPRSIYFPTFVMLLLFQIAVVHYWHWQTGAVRPVTLLRDARENE